MCAYTERDMNDQDALFQLLASTGLDGISGELFKHTRPDADGIARYRPAFGKNPSAQIQGLITRVDSNIEVVDATWWFDCQEASESLEVGKLTTFNARNLDSPYWKGAIRHHRAICLSTAVGEAKMIDGKKHQFRIVGEDPFLLGVVARPFSNGRWSCAVITRDSHPRFDRYHDKALPLFLPPDPSFIEAWLSDGMNDDVTHVLENPRLFNDFEVTPVKSYAKAVPVGETEFLESD